MVILSSRVSCGSRVHRALTHFHIWFCPEEKQPVNRKLSPRATSGRPWQQRNPQNCKSRRNRLAVSYRTKPIFWRALPSRKTYLHHLSTETSLAHDRCGRQKSGLRLKLEPSKNWYICKSLKGFPFRRGKMSKRIFLGRNQKGSYRGPVSDIPSSPSPSPHQPAVEWQEEELSSGLAFSWFYALPLLVLWPNTKANLVTASGYPWFRLLGLETADWLFCFRGDLLSTDRSLAFLHRTCWMQWSPKRHLMGSYGKTPKINSGILAKTSYQKRSWELGKATTKELSGN